jgi:hypothetical protein
MPATNTIGEQVIEAAVSGPDGANRLFICTGVAEVQMSLSRHQDQITETWTFFVGPALSRGQFYRAIGNASVSFQTMDILGHRQASRFRSSPPRRIGTTNLRELKCALKSYSAHAW